MVNVAVDDMIREEDESVIWAIMPTKLSMSNGCNRAVKPVMAGISHQQGQMIMENPL